MADRRARFECPAGELDARLPQFLAEIFGAMQDIWCEAAEETIPPAFWPDFADYISTMRAEAWLTFDAPPWVDADALLLAIVARTDRPIVTVVSPAVPIEQLPALPRGLRRRVISFAIFTAPMRPRDYLALEPYLFDFADEVRSQAGAEFGWSFRNVAVTDPQMYPLGVIGFRVTLSDDLPWGVSRPERPWRLPT